MTDENPNPTEAERLAKALMPLIELRERQRSWFRRVLLWIEHGLLVFVAVLLLISVLSFRASVEATNVGSCRAQLHAKIDTAQADKSNAQAGLDQLRTEADIARAQNLQVDLGPYIKKARRILKDENAAAKTQDSATKAYTAAVKLSRVDTTAFLKLCPSTR